MKQNEDYELVPSEGENWDIRILTGDFVETVIAFQNLKVTDDGENLSFNFNVVSSPDPTLDAKTNIDLQTTAGMILSSILEEAANTAAEKNKE